MAEFLVLSGDAYTVTADNEDEALAKMEAMYDLIECPCGMKDTCTCIQFAEARTEII